MVDNALLLYSDFVVTMEYLILKLEIPRMSYMSALLFDSRLIGLDVPDLAQLVFGSDS